MHVGAYEHKRGWTLADATRSHEFTKHADVYPTPAIFYIV